MSENLGFAQLLGEATAHSLGEAGTHKGERAGACARKGVISEKGKEVFVSITDRESARMSTLKRRDLISLSVYYHRLSASSKLWE